MKKVSVIAGGAGFVGVNLVRCLLAEDRRLFILDNLSRGKLSYLDEIKRVSLEQVDFIQVDLSDQSETADAFNVACEIGTVDEVWHLAANSDIPAGIEDPNVDLKDTFMSTYSILHNIKKHNVRSLFFASSSAIYGNLGDVPLHEEIGPLMPISNYGAMKLASEALISAATENYLDFACLFRFPNVVGVPSTHGVIHDFIRKLKVNRSELNVLGDGTQCKAYLHVSDLIAAMLRVRSSRAGAGILPINIGPVDRGVPVHWIAERVVERVSPAAVIRFGSGNRGWVGDVPRFYYSTSRIASLGWKPRLSSERAVLLAIDEIARQEGF